MRPTAFKSNSTICHVSDNPSELLTEKVRPNKSKNAYVVVVVVVVVIIIVIVFVVVVVVVSI